MRPEARACSTSYKPVLRSFDAVMAPSHFFTFFSPGVTHRPQDGLYIGEVYRYPVSPEVWVRPRHGGADHEPWDWAVSPAMSPLVDARSYP
jgi:hypothetical protein